MMEDSYMIHADSSIDNTSGSNSDMMESMSSMAMTFFSSINTPLFSNSWTPANTGQYSATCLFIIWLGAVLRLLFVLRPILENTIWKSQNFEVDPFLHQVRGTDLETMVSKGENVISGPKSPRLRHDKSVFNWTKESLRSWSVNWRFWPALGRATFDVILAGVAYLL
jgi:solute carrier family 31 (copper transporter), member 1